MARSSERDRGARGALWGIALILLGVLFLLQRQGVLPWEVWSTWWPIVVMMFGFGQLVTARRPKHVDEGVTWILMAVWFLVAVNDWHGLTWSRSWPLALIAVGGGTVARVIAERIMNRDGAETTRGGTDGVHEVRPND